MVRGDCNDMNLKESLQDSAQGQYNECIENIILLSKDFYNSKHVSKNQLKSFGFI